MIVEGDLIAILRVHNALVFESLAEYLILNTLTPLEFKKKRLNYFFHLFKRERERQKTREKWG